MHSCPTIVAADAFFESEDGELYLTLSKVATAQDLEDDHHLSYEGELIEQVSIPVTFCPYCGERLVSTPVTQATYHHFKLG